jgi:hypothetical protein
MQADDSDIAELSGARHERVEEDRWGGRSSVQIDLLAGLDRLDRFGWGNDARIPTAGTPGRPDARSESGV